MSLVVDFVGVGASYRETQLGTSPNETRKTRRTFLDNVLAGMSRASDTMREEQVE